MRSSRYSLRFSSVIGTPSFSKRLLHVFKLSSMARMPLEKIPDEQLF